MAKTNVGKMLAILVISQYKEMHLFDPHRNFIKTYRMQGRYQSRLFQNKNHPQPKSPIKPKISQSIIRTYGIL